jgi:hypothetical protein
MKMFDIAESLLVEYGFMGKYEGDMIRIGHFYRHRLPNPVEKNLLRVISNKINAKATPDKLRTGVYNDIEIPLFGQLISALSGNW